MSAILIRPDGSLQRLGRRWRPKKVLGTESIVNVRLMQDETPVGVVMASISQDRPRNERAQTIVAGITTQHIRFNGPVVIADIETEEVGRIMDGVYG